MRVNKQRLFDLATESMKEMRKSPQKLQLSNLDIQENIIVLIEGENLEEKLVLEEDNNPTLDL